MKTSSRPREVGGSFSSRRGHGAHLSISDTNHHVTEAIGDMYGDDDDWKRESTSRPLSFVPSPLNESIDDSRSYFGNSLPGRSKTYSSTRPPASPTGSLATKSHTLPALMPSQRSSSFEHTIPVSPLRDMAGDTANQQFPLNDIDYESDPAAVAQELSNLQALRRMSMDVGNTSDPDLPSFSGVSLMPAAAPTGDDDEDDPSRLFWVPARVHPELAPMEFKSFLENRVNSIKRRSGEQSSLSPDSLERSNSGSSLRRKKSMLSRQIDNSGGRGAVGYKDGADQLERKKSESQARHHELKISDLQELDELVRDPSKAMQKLNLDTALRKDVGLEDPDSEDMPILPAAPGVGLRRSTRTTYRRGSLRKGERVPFSKRAGARAAEVEAEGEQSSASLNGAPPIRVSSEPDSDGLSRPARGVRRGQNQGHYSFNDDQGIPRKEVPSSGVTRAATVDFLQEEPISQEIPRRKASYPRKEALIPQIVETPPQDDEPMERKSTNRSYQYPERSSSQTSPGVSQKSPERIEPPPRSSKRPGIGRQESSTIQTIPRVPAPVSAPQQGLQSTPPSQSMNHLTQHPSPLPGNTSRTDSLTFIPTFSEEQQKPSKKSKKDDEASGKKGSWGGWFKGGDEKDKKGKKKDEEVKLAKSRASSEKSHDSTRLDVLQQSIDTAVVRGRESLLLDRESIDNKLDTERKKESVRAKEKDKKEKDGIFSSLFGGGKKKGERDSAGKKASSLRTLSPDPPHRPMRPDIDYSWTRFSILEERAIYRMAHIKLANPRRALHSQVLLSNFMYSYLAKVQQMHPHVQIPQSAQQKKQQEAERKQKELEQQQLLQQQQQQGADNYRYDYHQGLAEYTGDQPREDQNEGVSYVDDSQIYAENQPSRQGQGDRDRPQSRASQHNSESDYGHGHGQSQDQYGRHEQDQRNHQYYQYSDRGHGSSGGRHHDEDDEDEMW